MISAAVEKLFSSFKAFWVGFSGGADSTAALLIASEWRDAHPECRVEAVHFDHHLRGGESAREAAAAAEFASGLAIPFRKIDLDVTDRGDGIEAAAREARLREWIKLAAERPGSAVVVGHHSDDRVENLLIRLFRGGNASALTALRERTRVCGVTFLRPLAGMSRAEVEAFLRGRGVCAWQSDSSNSSPEYARNYWRNTLLPQVFGRFPWGASGIRRALAALEEDARFIEDSAERYYASGDPGTCDFWRKAAPALRPRLLRRFLTAGAGVELIPSSAALARFSAALEAPDSGAALEVPIRRGMALYIQDGRVRLTCPPPDDVRWDWRSVPELTWGMWRLERRWHRDMAASGREEVCFDAALLPGEFVVGAARPGERMIPFGRVTPELLHKLRIDRRVRARDFPPVLRESSGRVWWACMVRRGVGAPISGSTTEAVCFYCRRCGEDNGDGGD